MIESGSPHKSGNPKEKMRKKSGLMRTYADFRTKHLSLRMLKSMTGYGIASFESGNTKYTVEIKSLNSKFLELSLRLPKMFSEKEFQLRNDCSKQIDRGKVNLSINVEQANSSVKAAGID